MPAKEIINDAELKMKKALEVLHNELKTVRSGSASTGLVENIKADFYGTPTPLKQMATLAAPQADVIIIKPFDPTSVKEIEKAIKNSDLSIAPVIDGRVIRLNIPALSGERRQQLVQQTKKNGEQTKVSIRNIRRDAVKLLEKDEQAKLITEDDMDNGKARLDELTKKYSDETDKIVKHKSDEILLN
jgi:ribosome recycling factor